MTAEMSLRAGERSEVQAWHPDWHPSTDAQSAPLTS